MVVHRVLCVHGVTAKSWGMSGRPLMISRRRGDGIFVTCFSDEGSIRVSEEDDGLQGFVLRKY